MRKISIFFILLLFTACGTVKGHKNSSINYVVEILKKYYPEDNAIEEKAEKIVEDLTGFNIDFSPLSEEKKEEKK